MFNSNLTLESAMNETKWTLYALNTMAGIGARWRQRVPDRTLLMAPSRVKCQYYQISIKQLPLYVPDWSL